MTKEKKITKETTKIVAYRIIAFLIFAAVLFIVSRYIKPSFEVDDDGAIRGILSGKGIGSTTPDSHAVFLSFPLTYILKTLYTISDSIPWYGIWNLIIILGAEACVLHAFITKERKNIAIKLLVIVSFSFCMVGFFILEQWTIVAGIIGGIGILMLMATKLRVLPVILFVMSYAERASVIYMLLPFIVLAVLFRYYDEKITLKNIKPKLLKVVATLLAVVVLIGCAKVINDSFYKSAEWQEYTKFNNSRSAVLDFSDFNTADKSKYIDIFKKKGIDQNLYDPIKHWETELDSKIDSKTMTTVAEGVAKVNSNENKVEALKTSWKTMTEDKLTILMGFMTICLFILVFILNSSNTDRFEQIKNFLFTLASLLVSIAMVGYLVYIGRPISRVFAALFVALFMFLVGILAKILKDKKEGNAKLFAVILLVFVCICSYYFVSFRATSNYYGNKVLNEEKVLMDYIKENSDKVCIMNVMTVYKAADSVFDENERMPNLLTDGGWLSKSPIRENPIKKLGCKDTADILYNKDSLYIIERWLDYNWLKEYMNKRFGKVTLKEIKYIRSNKRFWTVVQVCK